MLKQAMDEHINVVCVYASVQLAGDYNQHRTTVQQSDLIEQLLFGFYSPKDFCFSFVLTQTYVYAEMHTLTHSHMHTCQFFMPADRLYRLGAPANQELFFTAKRHVSHFWCRFTNSSSEIYLKKMQTQHNSNNFKFILSVAKHPSNEIKVKLKTLLLFTCC